MRTSPFPACLGALLSAALFAPLPAASQMYKWTDERGVVSYSNTPPPSAGKAAKVDVVEDRISVYTPDPLTLRAMAEEEANSRDAKAGTRKREADTERRARSIAPNDSANAAAQRQAQMKSAYERCVADRRVECDTILSGNPSPASSGYNGLPQYVIGARVAALPTTPFYVDPTPPARIGVSTAPPVGVSTAPPVGISTTPPIGAMPPSRPVGSSR